MVSLAAPVVAGLLAQLLSPTWGYALAALGAALALACILALPKAPAPTTGGQRPSFVASIQAGAHFVVRHELLRGISLCAICWNFASFALLAICAPLALRPSGRSVRRPAAWGRPTPDCPPPCCWSRQPSRSPPW